MITTINPTTGEQRRFPAVDPGKLPQFYDRAAAAFGNWSSLPLPQRIERLRPALAKLEAQREDFALRISTEMGKPLAQARIEIDRSIEEFGYTLSHAEQWLAEEPVATGVVRFDPLGVVGVICPWNFPVLLPLRSIVPALVAGNCVLFKPSELTPDNGLALGELFELDAGVMQTVIGDKALGAELVKLPLRAICFTGSTEVGRAINVSAASRFIRVILELGGLDAAIVLGDCDIESTAAEIVRRNAGNSGQTCNSIKRVYVEEQIYPAFLEAAASFSRNLRLGDPLDETTDMGPLVSQAQLDRVERFAKDALERGAHAHSGGKVRKSPGFFFEHTVFSGVPDEAALLHDEPFGPLLPILPVKNWQEGVQRANATVYGLMSSVWTADQRLAREVADRLEVGTACINNHLAGPAGTPWGGTKSSGVGRMKTREGLREFTNTKLVRFPN